MNLLLTLLSLSFAVGGPDNETPSMWHDLCPVKGQSYWYVAGNEATNKMWAVIREYYSSGRGFKIAEYDFKGAVWRVDTSQPKGS